MKNETPVLSSRVVLLFVCLMAILSAHVAHAIHTSRLATEFIIAQGTATRAPVTGPSLLDELRTNSERLNTFIAVLEISQKLSIAEFVRTQYDRSTTLRNTLPPELKRDVESVYSDLAGVAQLSLMAKATAGTAGAMPFGMGKQIVDAQRQNVLAAAKKVQARSVIDRLDRWLKAQ